MYYRLYIKIDAEKLFIKIVRHSENNLSLYSIFYAILT